MARKPFLTCFCHHLPLLLASPRFPSYPAMSDPATPSPKRNAFDVMMKAQKRTLEVCVGGVPLSLTVSLLMVAVSPPAQVATISSFPSRSS
jgi:hypothetical protein